jgi:diguanylate cyclase (GGDEF)-like protein
LKKAEKAFRTLIAAPLLSENKVIGILRMDSLREDAYSQDDLRLLDILADLGAAAVENAILYSKTQELAIKDSLTGLFVRRYFSERFHEEVQRAAMKKGELALLILDIDNFKNYNDEYGHAAGDLVLRYLSRTLNGLVRGGDMVARYGGEELIILLVGRNKKDAASEAEEFRKTIKEKPLSFRRHVANITISIGLAGYPEDGVLEEELMKLADKRLYKAKKGGRDRVCSS